MKVQITPCTEIFAVSILKYVFEGINIYSSWDITTNAPYYIYDTPQCDIKNFKDTAK